MQACGLLKSSFLSMSTAATCKLLSQARVLLMVLEPFSLAPHVAPRSSGFTHTAKF